MPTTTYGQHTVNALGTFATLLVADPAALGTGRDLLAAELAAIDAACSRFRPDSELSRACAAGGHPVPVSPLFAEALSVALTAAELTDGDVDPTCGQALARLGYDRDFASARQDTSFPVPAARARRRLARDPSRHRPPGGDGSRRVLLDLGATAKALAADRAAAAIAAAIGCGVLVNLGGDISVAGQPPEGGWLVGVADDATFDTTTTTRPDQSGDRDQGRRARYVQRARPRVAAGRHPTAPHHRSAHRDARELLLAHRQRRGGKLRRREHREHRRDRARRARGGLAGAALPSGPARPARRQRRHGRGLARPGASGKHGTKHRK